MNKNRAGVTTRLPAWKLSGGDGTADPFVDPEPSIEWGDPSKSNERNERRNLSVVEEYFILPFFACHASIAIRINRPAGTDFPVPGFPSWSLLLLSPLH